MPFPRAAVPRFRRYIDPANSLAWFAMDFFWLAQWPWPAYLAMVLTLTTGGMLLQRNRGDDLALNAWMGMNALWLVSDLGGLPLLRYAAMALGIVGAALLVSAVRPTKRKRKVLRRFRKLRPAR